VQVEPSVILAILGAAATALLGAIGKLFLALLAAKDAHITFMSGTIEYQRTLLGRSIGTTDTAVKTVDRIV
jgi:hypothetical protein